MTRKAHYHAVRRSAIVLAPLVSTVSAPPVLAAPPETDAETVVAILGSEGLFALDAGSGEVRWKMESSIRARSCRFGLGPLLPGPAGASSSPWLSLSPKPAAAGSTGPPRSREGRFRCPDPWLVERDG